LQINSIVQDVSYGTPFSSLQFSKTWERLHCARRISGRYRATGFRCRYALCDSRYRRWSFTASNCRSFMISLVPCIKYCYFEQTTYVGDQVMFEINDGCSVNSFTITSRLWSQDPLLGNLYNPPELLAMRFDSHKRLELDFLSMKTSMDCHLLIQ